LPKTNAEQEIDKAARELRANVASQYNALLEKSLTEANGGISPTFDELQQHAQEIQTEHGSMIFWKTLPVAFIGHPEVTRSEEGAAHVRIRFYKMV
jgi:hypothetical protein